MFQNLEFVRQRSRGGSGCALSLLGISKCIFSKQKQRPFTEEMVVVVSLVVVSVLLCSSKVQGAYRYSLESCSDLVPRLVPDRPTENNHQLYEHQQQQTTPSWQNSNGFVRRIKREYNEPPFRITVPGGKRYRRNVDLNVQMEGKGYYDAIMIQGRAVSSGGDFISGGVGLLGKFDSSKLDRRNYSYLECFRQPHGTVVDNGYTRLGNSTFVWTPPDDDKGNIRFLAGITKGGHYWIITSSILHFNPFPISTVQCGGQEACFRVCPLDYRDSLCGSSEAILMYNYNTDLVGKREVEFTLGGNLPSNQTSYIGVVYAEDNDNLYQADVTVCYIDEHGRAQVGHFLMEVVGGPLIQHTEDINIDDFDYDGNMLWCRYRRPISHLHTSVINPWKTFYTLLYKGEINPQGYPKFQTPSRSNMYSSDAKLNLSTPINNIYSGSLHFSYFTPSIYAILSVAVIVFEISFWFTNLNV